LLRALDPFRFLLIAVADWMNQHQLLVIDYLREKNRMLREQLGGRRLRFTDDQAATVVSSQNWIQSAKCHRVGGSSE
jgi:hypothetical protein